MKGMIEKFNKGLNESIFSDGTFERWDAYRASVTKMAADVMRPGGSTLLAGAGNMFDINIREISDISNRLVLADIDIDSVNRGIKRTGIISNKVSVEKMDLCGMDGKDIIGNISFKMKDHDTGFVKEYIDGYRFTSQNEYDVEKYDNILISSIYTQLFIPQFAKIMGSMKISDAVMQELLESALAFTGRLITQANNDILHRAKKDAAVCVWSDILEYDNADIGLGDIIKHIDDTVWMDAFYESYLMAYGHGLGSYGIFNLEDRLTDNLNKWFIWPFNEQRTMIVKAVSGYLYTNDD